LWFKAFKRNFEEILKNFEVKIEDSLKIHQNPQKVSPRIHPPHFQSTSFTTYNNASQQNKCQKTHRHSCSATSDDKKSTKIKQQQHQQLKSTNGAFCPE
jgi:uncharacterized protein (DUF2344 family)